VKLNARWANQLRHVTADQWRSTNLTTLFQGNALKEADICGSCTGTETYNYDVSTWLYTAKFLTRGSAQHDWMGYATDAQPASVDCNASASDAFQHTCSPFGLSYRGVSSDAIWAGLGINDSRSML
jgi:hypothetical protein